eukprot:SAG25_NODE_656_length_6116_cov_8.686389_4_plen_187_part_00
MQTNPHHGPTRRHGGENTNRQASLTTCKGGYMELTTIVNSDGAAGWDRMARRNQSCSTRTAGDTLARSEPSLHQHGMGGPSTAVDITPTIILIIGHIHHERVHLTMLIQHQKRFDRRAALQRFGRGLPLCYGLRVLNRSTRCAGRPPQRLHCWIARPAVEFGQCTSLDLVRSTRWIVLSHLCRAGV